LSRKITSKLDKKDLSNVEKGGLVSKILQTKKELEGADEKDGAAAQPAREKNSVLRDVVFY
jgi:hypothetical protein